MADNRTRCRHQAVTSYLGEDIDSCGSSCDVCTGHDILQTCATAAEKRPRRARPTGATTFVDRGAPDDAAGDEGEVFARLRELRRQIASQRGIPAYMVFSDAVLLAMAERRPRNAEEVLAISGVG